MFFIDDILILSKSQAQGVRDTQRVVDLLHSLGFAILPKSMLAPAQSGVEFLGFLLNSLDCSLSLPGRKIRDLR